ncbi:MAG: o-succinylbenzoate---CoA ligase [Actinomycetota bacterium]|nr:o-succinylbenzoate---CoA ligase [Actinomycetota bacterium]
MPPASASRTSAAVLEVAAGLPGLRAMTHAVGDALDAGRTVALVPGYAPAAVQRDLQARLAAGLGEPSSARPIGSSVILPTSGSTGAPRLVVLSRQALLASATARDEVLGGPSAWFIALPPVTAATLIAVVRGHLAGLPVAGWPGIGGAQRFSPSAFTTAARDLVTSAAARCVPARTSLVSAQLARLLADAEATAVLREFATVLVGGGPLAPELAQQARDAKVPITATYGMTETCGGCVYDGLATPGTVVALAADGEILLGGDPLASGYLTEPLPLQDGLLRTGDRGHFAADGRLHVVGRFDDIVTVRGANVDLAAVTAVVQALPGVAEAAVVGEVDPDGGHRLIAHVVGEAEDDTIRTAVANRLGAAAIPQVRRVEALPRLPGGKVDTQQLVKGPR